MSFDHPGLAAGALLALLPPILHLLARRRAQPKPFAALEFLLRAQRGGQRRLRLRRLLLLLARMALLAAIPLALARPHRTAAAATAARSGGPEATALVIDGSGSMRYRAGGQSLFEKAQRAAARRLADLRGDEPATVLLCAPRADPAPAPTGERASLLERLRGFRATAEPVELTDCLAQAAQLLGQSELPAKRIVVFTDLTQSDWDLGRAPPSVIGPSGSVRPEVEVVDVAEGPLPNLWLSELAIRRSEAVGPRGYTFEVTVHNSGLQPQTNVPLALELGGQVVSRGFCDLSAWGTERKTLAATLPSGEVVEGRIALPADALAEDDALAFVVPVPRQLQALIVDGAPSSLRYLDEAFFVATALGAAAGVVSTRTADADAFGPRDLQGLDVLLLLDVRQLHGERSDAVRGFVQRGGGLLIALGDHTEPETLDAELGTLLPAQLRSIRTAGGVADSKTGKGEPETAGDGNALAIGSPAHFATIAYDSPIFAGFGGGSTEGLLDTKIFRYVQVEPPDKGSAVLASFDDGSPALLLAQRGGGRVLLFTSSLAREWTDWPIRSSFVPAIQQAVQFLGGAANAEIPAASVVGSRRNFPPAAEAPGQLVPREGRLPSGRRLSPERAAGRLTLGPLPEVGLVRVEATAGAAAPVASSRSLDFAVAFDPRESDTRRLDPREVEARYGSTVQNAGLGAAAFGGGGGLDAWPLWSELLVAALLLFGAETWLAS